MKQFGYNIAELPITDIGHTMRVIKISRAIDEHLAEDKRKRRNYLYQKRKKKFLEA